MMAKDGKEKERLSITSFPLIVVAANAVFDVPVFIHVENVCSELLKEEAPKTSSLGS